MIFTDSKQQKSCTAASKLRLRDVAVILLLCPTHAISNADRLQEVPLPPNVTAQAVALDVVQHGHRMSMATLKNAYPVENIIDFYRQEWSTPVAPGLPGFIENKAENLHMISRLEDGWNTVVQMRGDDTGSEAFVSVFELEPVANWSYSPVMPRNAVLVSSTSATEFGKPTQTDVVFSRDREGSVARFYRDHYTNNNWDIVSDRKINGSTVLMLQRTGAQAEVVVTPADNGSVAVLNQVGRYE